jgi:hypothetical protein
MFLAVDPSRAWVENFGLTGTVNWCGVLLRAAVEDVPTLPLSELRSDLPNNESLSAIDFCGVFGSAAWYRAFFVENLGDLGIVKDLWLEFMDELAEWCAAAPLLPLDSSSFRCRIRSLALATPSSAFMVLVVVRFMSDSDAPVTTRRGGGAGGSGRSGRSVLRASTAAVAWSKWLFADSFF